MFAVEYGHTTQRSRITFGGWNKDIVQNEKDIHWCPLAEQKFWSASLERVNYGSKDLRLDVKQAIFDTGASSIAMHVSKRERKVICSPVDRPLHCNRTRDSERGRYFLVFSLI